MIDQIQYLAARVQKKLRLNAVRGTKMSKGVKIESGSQVVESNIGRYTFCGYDCVILNCEIGSFCSIADKVYIGGSQHPMHFVSTSPVFLSHRDSIRVKFARHSYSMMPRTNIGHDVWIGHGAKIKGGIDVGTGAVVGMGSVVTKDVAPYSVVAGNPARELRRRFGPEIIDGLLKSRWWEAGETELAAMAEHFNDPEKFLNSL